MTATSTPRDSVERSSELLRLAIPLMARHGAALDPITYSVWYHYLSGRVPELTRAVDARIEAGERVDDATTEALYNAHLLHAQARRAERVSEQLDRVMEQVSDSAQQSSRRAGGYEQSLDAFSQHLALGADTTQLRADVRQTMLNTQDIKSAMGALIRVLDTNRAEVESLREQLRQSHEMALSDALTGLRNRNGFNEALRELVTHSAEQEAPLCLLLLDLDHFKRINDTYGHLLGDKVLRTIARILTESVRGADTVCRFGGEEFAILLPDTPLAGAVTVGESLCSNIARGRIRDANEKHIDQVTVSIGVGLLHRDETPESFIGRVDQALYESKKAGRNRVTVARGAPVLSPE